MPIDAAGIGFHTGALGDQFSSPHGFHLQMLLQTFEKILLQVPHESEKKVRDGRPFVTYLALAPGCQCRGHLTDLYGPMNLARNKEEATTCPTI